MSTCLICADWIEPQKWLCENCSEKSINNYEKQESYRIGVGYMKDLKTVLIICEELLNKGYVDAVKEVLKETNRKG